MDTDPWTEFNGIQLNSITLCWRVNTSPTLGIPNRVLHFHEVGVQFWGFSFIREKIKLYR